MTDASKKSQTHLTKEGALKQKAQQEERAKRLRENLRRRKQAQQAQQQ